MKLQTHNKDLLLFLLILFFCSCKKELKPDNPASSKVDIYVTGFESSGNCGDCAYAKYWKNGIATNLTDGLHKSEANSIFVSGKDVYVAGYENNNTYSPIAKYWKNGVAVKLADSAVANSIFVSGKDVYVAGTQDAHVVGSSSMGFTDPIYWKNGVAVKLGENGYASSIVVSGNDVYVAGYLYQGGATYWKNGQKKSLAGYYQFETAIAVSGSDVYVTQRSNPAYWKNGIPVNFFTNNSGSALAIAVSGNDVYIGGWEAINGEHTGAYWKNGARVILPQHSSVAVTGIAVSGNDIYVCGMDNIKNGNNYLSVPTYWKNGNPVTLSNPTVALQSVNSIFVLSK